MAITKNKEEKKATILQATAYQFRMSETMEHQWKRKYKKNNKKFSDTVGAEVQTRMKKFVKNITDGIVWEEDWRELTSEILKIVSKE